MSKSILIEAYNLTLARGTGIKTYVKALSDIACELGYKVDALLQSDRRLNRRDNMLAEIAFFEGVSSTNWKDRYLREPLEVAVGVPFGLRAHGLARTGIVLQGSTDDLLARYNELFVAYRFVNAARRHFRRHGRLLELKPDRTPDLFHLTHLAPVRVRGAANICTVHDVIPLRLPNATLDNKKHFLNSLRVLCRDCDRILTVSECSKRDILSIVDMPEDKIDVTYQAVSLPPALLERDEAQTANILDNIFRLEMGGYFLFFGALEPKKNVSRLIDAYAASGVKAPLVIAGGLGWSYESEVKQIDQEHFSSWRIREEEIRRERRVRHVDHVPLSHLVALIRGARAVLFPSLYEGFGLPVLEAMTLGAPVMTSNVASLPEVAGEAALYVDPYDIDEMTRAIVALDTDADLRQGLKGRGLEQAKKFSMDIYARRIAAAYDATLR
ncbi:glycosyltransferase family 1 protein [Bosea sp. 117]|uniref:glycosyltransferase family 4 protein n=1 Tax=Bosea sp. 117 TaxID=1125973 RepID=UPI000493E9E6|nr:glycosyltransferase family 1 protein [Bosea sp. 117]